MCRSPPARVARARRIDTGKSADSLDIGKQLSVIDTVAKAHIVERKRALNFVKMDCVIGLGDFERKVNYFEDALELTID